MTAETVESPLTGLINTTNAYFMASAVAIQGLAEAFRLMHKEGKGPDQETMDMVEKIVSETGVAYERAREEWIKVVGDE